MMQDASGVAVSVIIPCYRSGAGIRRAAASVFGQTAPPAELILVDDASGDGTAGVLREIAATRARPAVTVIELERNGGPGAARNAGWRRATQPYIAFLDHDDSWHPGKLELQYRWMLDHPEVVLTGHPLAQAHAGITVPTAAGPTAARPVSRYELLVSNRFQTSSVMVRSNLTYRFDESRQCLEDYLLWLQIVLSGRPAYRFQPALGMQHKSAYGASGLSAQLWTMERGELAAYRRVWREGLLSLPACAVASAISLAKYCRRALITRLRRPGAERPGPAP